MFFEMFVVGLVGFLGGMIWHFHSDEEWDNVPKFLENTFVGIGSALLVVYGILEMEAFTPLTIVAALGSGWLGSEIIDWAIESVREKIGF